MFFDIHGDIWTDVAVKRGKGLSNVIKDYHLDRFKAGNMVGGIFINWVDPPYDSDPEKRIMDIIRHMFVEIHENQDILRIMDTADDFQKAIDEGKLAVLLGLEGLSGIGDKPDWIYTLHRLGFRHMSLTWNEENPLATGVSGNPDRGLTDLGKKAVKIINDMGIILDVSHTNDKTFWDITKVTDKPFIASHSNSRSLCDIKRNLTDDQIKHIGQTNGLIGINAYSGFVHKDKDKRDVDHLINHIEHMGNLIGLDKIAFGFDFFEYIEEDSAGSFIDEPYRGTIGLEDISKTDNLVNRLKDRGFSQEDIDGLAYKNFLNLMKRI